MKLVSISQAAPASIKSLNLTLLPGSSLFVAAASCTNGKLCIEAAFASGGLKNGLHELN